MPFLADFLLTCAISDLLPQFIVRDTGRLSRRDNKNLLLLAIISINPLKNIVFLDRAVYLKMTLNFGQILPTTAKIIFISFLILL